MKKRIKCLFITGLCIILAFSVSQGGAFWQIHHVQASKIDELKKKNEEDQEKLDELDTQIDELSGEQQGIESEISALSEQIAQIMASISILEDEIVAKKQEIKQAKKDLEEAQRIESEQYASMKLRIKAMYESGDINYLDIFMSATSMEELLNKADYIEKIHEYDQKMLQNYKAAREQVEALKEQLEIEEAELEATQHELEEEQQGIELARAELEEISADYVVQISKAKQQAEVYKLQIKQQNEQIKKLEEEERRRLEEERRKAEEAARKAAEAKKKNNGSSSSSDSSSKPKGTAAVNKDEIMAASGSSKGKEIAIYACGFVGNPYVPGGTSLTNGADCSGFTQSVYKAFGYSIPRNSYSQRSAGKQVSYAEAQPGDIICYAGHVAIYIGNGKIVHASTVKTGIKISYATYREILSVRRIV